MVAPLHFIFVFFFLGGGGGGLAYPIRFFPVHLTEGNLPYNIMLYGSKT